MESFASMVPQYALCLRNFIGPILKYHALIKIKEDKIIEYLPRIVDKSALN
jgi:hypothetical protein